MVRRGTKRDNGAWEQRRNEIVDTAAHLFATNGYHATGVAELGEAVQLGRGALYYYITSKENLLSLIHDRVIVDVLAAGEKATALEGTASERLRFLGGELLRIIVSFPDHVWVFLHEFRSLQGEAADEFRKSRRVFERAIEQILEDGVDAASSTSTALAWPHSVGSVCTTTHTSGSTRRARSRRSRSPTTSPTSSCAASRCAEVLTGTSSTATPGRRPATANRCTRAVVGRPGERRAPASQYPQS